MAANYEQVLSALGPLAKLYADPDVLEIMVDTPELVFVERKGELQEAGVTFPSRQAIQSVIDALLALNDETTKPGETILPIRFLGGEARGVAVLPPTATAGPCLVIRKLMNIDGISWEKLIEWGSVSPEAYQFLQRAVRARTNILMAGGTNSGKTTVLNRIAELIPAEQRLVIVENQHELQIRHPRAVYLEAAGQPGLSMDGLIQTGTLLRPDWLVFGELKGAEALQAVQVLGSGHTGLTTIHGNSLEDSLMHLETMCLMANMGLGLLEIRSLIASALRLVLYQKYMPDGRRKITEIVELRGVENGQFVLECLFRYNPEKDRLDETGIKSSWE